MTNYVRFENKGNISFGVLEGDSVSEISNAPFDGFGIDL